MKKINPMKLLYCVLIIISICILKNGFIIDAESNAEFIRKVLIFWGPNQLVNLIWFLPVLLNLYIIAKVYFYHLQQFEMRFRHRKRFVNNMLLSCCLTSLMFNLIVAIVQVIILFSINKTSIILNLPIISILIHYTIENTFLNLIIILFAMFLKNFMYAYIVTLISIIITLSITTNNIYLPFINMYFSSEISVITILSIIITIILTKKLYIHQDIGGVE
ncbi:MAG: hypothetical protein PHC65_06075 [Methanobacteriaceae archaeon]|nr:hypothetical protein [Methanobacteriaceae archaeon]MDD3408478.1 hypothetical protein [Methanobacteriaceae archaeon]